MKNTKRAYRRYKDWTKFKRRVDIWINMSSWYVCNEEQRQDMYNGKSHLKLRTQGRPCNCSMCTPDPHWQKYKRPTKEAVRKIIDEQLE